MYLKKVFIFIALGVTILSLSSNMVIAQEENPKSILIASEKTNLLGENYGLFTSEIFSNLKSFKLPPKPKPKPKPEPKVIAVKYASTDVKRVKTPGNYEAMIRKTCAEYKCSEYEITKIFIPMMYGESGGDNTRINYSSNSSGLFQHLPQYWDGRVKRILGASVVPNIWSPTQQIKISIHMFKAENQGAAWVASKCGYMDIQYGKDYTDKRRAAGNCWDPDNTMRVGG